MTFSNKVLQGSSRRDVFLKYQLNELASSVVMEKGAAAKEAETHTEVSPSTPTVNVKESVVPAIEKIIETPYKKEKPLEQVESHETKDKLSSEYIRPTLIYSPNKKFARIRGTIKSPKIRKRLNNILNTVESKEVTFDVIEGVDTWVFQVGLSDDVSDEKIKNNIEKNLVIIKWLLDNEKSGENILPIIIENISKNDSKSNKKRTV